MASKRLANVLGWLERRGVSFIGEPEYAALGEAFPEIRPDSLRKLLRLTGLRLAPIVEGVRQDDFHALGRTLSALAREYEAGDAFRRGQCRRLVITAKDHARLASRTKPQKIEMVEWMLVWLGNPGIFEDWLRVKVPSAGTPENTDT